MSKNSNFFFTSESVTEGHPDKLCDQVSDGILDALLAGDPHSRVAVETMSGTGFVHLGGEVSTKAWVDFGEVARNVIRDIGYVDSSMGFDANTCSVMVSIGQQSPDIAQGVTEGEGLHVEQGAGDQGLMFGYATNETPSYMPTPIALSHALSSRLASVRKDGTLGYLRPDGKSQVCVQYEGSRPVRLDSVVISTQHAEDVDHKTIVEDVKREVVLKAVDEKLIDSNTRFYINPTGRFVVGGPMGDCGLTGRKIIVDTYGGWGRHGGGAFSGKDPSKVDRSAAYMARYVAKNIVASGVADRAEIQLAYAIGVAEPVSVHVDTFGTNKVDEDKIVTACRELFPLKPKDLIQKLNLLNPVYRQTAAYGHFGRSGEGFTWEKTDMADAVKDFLS